MLFFQSKSSRSFTNAPSVSFLPERIRQSSCYSLPLLWLSCTISCAIKSLNHSMKRDPFGELYVMQCSKVRKGQARLWWILKLDDFYHRLNISTENGILSSQLKVYCDTEAIWNRWLVTQVFEPFRSLGCLLWAGQNLPLNGEPSPDLQTSSKLYVSYYCITVLSNIGRILSSGSILIAHYVDVGSMVAPQLALPPHLKDSGSLDQSWAWFNFRVEIHKYLLCRGGVPLGSWFLPTS